LGPISEAVAIGVQSYHDEIVNAVDPFDKTDFAFQGLEDDFKTSMSCGCD
jgi:hypothetical protein